MKGGAVGVVKPLFMLAKQSIGFPENTHLPAVVIPIADPEAAIGDGINRGAHRRLHDTSRQFHRNASIQDPSNITESAPHGGYTDNH